MSAYWSTLLILFGVTFSQLVEAKILKPWTHFGLRPLAMGNAYVAVADDYNSLFYNPAGLARLKSWDGELFNPSIIIAKNSTDIISSAQDNLTGEDNTNEIITFIEDNTGKDQSLRLALAPHLIFPNFGFAIGLETNISATFRRFLGVDLQLRTEVILPIAYAMNFFEDKLSVGVGLKLRALAEVDEELSLDEFSNEDNFENFVKAGHGFGADIGLLFTPTKIMEPTIGLSITDFGGTSFTEADFGDQEANLGNPSIQLPSVNLGFSLKPYKKDRQYLRLAVDMHSINQPHSSSLKLQSGLEYGFGDFFKSQLGLYKGYLSAGLQLDAGIVNLRLATYAEEIGAIAGQSPSRRFALQLKVLL